MSDALDQRLLEALLDSWDRNNTVLLNLLRTLPEGGLEARAMEGSPSIAELFTHIHNAERLMGEDVNAMVCVGGDLCRLDLWIGEAVSA